MGRALRFNRDKPAPRFVGYSGTRVPGYNTIGRCNPLGIPTRVTWLKVGMQTFAASFFVR
eukprot:3940353-Rhodomonas_salina.1